MKTLNDLDFNLKGKRILVRCDFNCPLNEKGEILDDFRIQATLPTIKYLIKKKAKIILISHLGRPDGKVVESLRLNPIQKRLEKYLKTSIRKTQNCLGEEVEKKISKMKESDIVLLENIQFYPGEKNNEEYFAESLSNYGEFFVMEAFGQAHRNYASIVGITKYLPSVAGFLFEKEIKVLTKLRDNPLKPLIVIIGGAKVEDKARVISKFLVNSKFLLIGELIEKEIKNKGLKFDFTQKIVAPVDSVNTFDIGEKTIKIFKEKIFQAKTIFWSGPLGKIEEEKYQRGSKEIAKAIIKSGAFSVVGGGETVEFINQLGLTDKFNHVSTGGGAMLAFLSGEKLPGIEALK